MFALVHQVVQSVLVVVLNNDQGGGLSRCPRTARPPCLFPLLIFWYRDRANRSDMTKNSLRVAADGEQVPWRALGCRS